MIYKNLSEFYSQYAMPLAQALHNIEQRGLLVDEKRLAKLKLHVADELGKETDEIQKLIGLPITVRKQKGKDAPLCLNAPQDVLKILKLCNLHVPKNRITHKESTDETTLQRIFGETAHPVVKHILSVRELAKLQGTYLNATLYNSVLYCSYIAIGTVGGRRSCRTNFLGLGTNHQNIPKHSELGRQYRQCIVARPGKIFVSCDQKGAEDWIVQAIIADAGANDRGLQELIAGINRHKRLAAFLFGRPESDCGKSSGSPPGIFYNLGKRTRHAGNYGMRENRMSETLAKEGVAVPPTVCKTLLERFHSHEPEIQGVFQAFVEGQLRGTRTLSTPVGRQRQFLSLRPYADNSTIFREAYSYIPQSTVADNTGLSILYCERESPGLVVSDGHDANYLEVSDNKTNIENGVELLAKSFKRKLPFPNGLEIEIPVEFEIGYDLGHTFAFDTMDQLGKAYNSAQASKETLDQVVC